MVGKASQMTFGLKNKVQRVRFAREAGSTTRLHTHRYIGEYDVAQHTFNALCLLRVLNPTASQRLIWAVLSHDLPERFTGDIPSPAKRNGDWFDPENYAKHEAEILNAYGFNWEALDKEERLWLEIVDSLEFFLFCLDQKLLGNNSLDGPGSKIVEYIDEKCKFWPASANNFYISCNRGYWKPEEEM